eukprot:2255694-Prymnesium_polylepis.1
MGESANLNSRRHRRVRRDIGQSDTHRGKPRLYMLDDGGHARRAFAVGLLVKERRARPEGAQRVAVSS